MAVTPAGAEVSSAVATNWKKIWKKNLKPLAAKNFYTKKQSKSRFAGRAESAAAAAAAQSAATSAANSATDSKLGNFYTKAQGDAKYAPTPSVIRGTYDILGYSSAADQELADNIPFGWTLPSAPTPHYINEGAAVPAGCSGSAAAPNADPGHLCIFEAQNNLANLRRVISATGNYGQTSPFGVGVTVTTTAAGNVYVYGSWAVRPGTPITAQGRVAPSRAVPGSVAGD